MLRQCAGGCLQLRAFLCLTPCGDLLASGASRGGHPFCGGGLPGGKAGRRRSLPGRSAMSELAGEQASLQHVSEEKEEKGRMQHPSLERIAERLSKQMRGAQEDLCRPIVQQITRGKPVASAALRAALRVNLDELEQRLGKLPSDVEFDRTGNIVGLGVTLE